MNSRQPNRGPDRLSRSLTLARGFASASALLLVLFGVVPAAIAAPGWQSMPELRNHSNALGMKQAQGQNSQPSASFPDQVVALTNAERAAAGLPPLKSNAILMKAADSHSQAMAVGHYMAHEDPNTGTNPGQRITAAGYKWTTVGENVAAGQDSPQQVVMSWMGSPGHRANILNSAFREIGVGYAYDPNDTSGCGDLGCKHYWTQNFGASADGFPLVINGETPSTDVNTVNLFLYGGDWAREMRLSNDGGPFTAWEPFTSNLSWKLLNQPGLRTVTGEIRDGSRVSTASDTILLSPQSQAVTPSPGDSHTAVQQASTSTTGAQISLSTSTASPATTAQQVPSPGQVDEVVLDRQVSASKVGVTDELTITLTLSPTNFTCDRVVRRTPADVVLVVDRSSSMLDSLGVLGASKLEGAKQAAKIFVDQMDKTKDQIGLVQFNEQADLVGQLTGDTSATKASIDSMTGDDGTNISAGISTAYKELTGGRHRTEAIRVIVLLSDGQSESGPATQAADLAKSEGSRRSRSAPTTRAVRAPPAR